MSTTLDDLKEEFPQYRLTIERMNREGKTFEEVMRGILFLIETQKKHPKLKII